MIEKLKAKNNFVILKRHPAKEETKGLLLPDVAKRKPQTGDILSVGVKVEDKTIKVGQVAYFHSTAGFELEIEGEVVFVLRSQDVIACDDKK